MAETVPVTVCTPSIPSRAIQLQRAIASVQRQTVRPEAHLISIGEAEPGESRLSHLVRTRNALAQAVDTDWLAILDDDDWYLPRHFETIAPYLETDADVVYTFSEGPYVNVDVTGWTAGELVAQLQVSNVIAANAAVRVSRLEDLGGWSDTYFNPDTHLYDGGPVCHDDWELWLMMARAGARFLCVPQETWHYDFEPNTDRQTARADELMARTKKVVLHG